VTISQAQEARYRDQVTLEGWGEKAQERLASASVLIVGAGALGSAAAMYLVAAGVGRVGIVDAATVELAGIASEPLHYTPDVGRLKAENAALKLGVLNPLVQIDPFPVRIDATNAAAIVAGADVVVDCSNSAATTYVVNDACCAEGVGLVAASFDGLAAIAITVRPGISACYSCAFPDAPTTGRATAGPFAGMLGSIQALEALKLLTSSGEPLVDRVLRLDGVTLCESLTPVSRRGGCPSCALALASSIAAAREPVA